MSVNEPAGRQARTTLQRSRHNRIVGGVCAGIADHLGIDPVLVRIVTVLLGILSAGAAVLAYLIAWVLIPPGQDEPAPRVQLTAAEAGEAGAREAWKAVGTELRTLAAGLRPDGPTAAEQPDPTTAAGDGAAAAKDHGARRPVEAVDAAMTAFGERLRDPEVQEGARRAAAGLSAAVGASVDEIGKRAKRTKRTKQPSAPGAPPSVERTDGPD